MPCWSGSPRPVATPASERHARENGEGSGYVLGPSFRWLCSIAADGRAGIAFPTSTLEWGHQERKSAMAHAPRIPLAIVALLAAIAVIPQQAAAKGQVPFRAAMTETSAAF